MRATGARLCALIPARGGSKGLARKNLRAFRGTPLVAHAVETARQVRGLDRIVVSTDDHEIAEVARRAGAEVPFLRPPELATDETPTLPVVQHDAAGHERIVHLGGEPVLAEAGEVNGLGAQRRRDIDGAEADAQGRGLLRRR